MNTRFIKDLNDKSDWPGTNDFVFIVDATAVSDTDTAFDALMRDVAGPNTTVYLGPGVWKTRGVGGNNLSQADAPGWRLQAGGKLVGAGTDKTTLLLVACNSGHGAVIVGSCSEIGGKPTTAKDICVSDMTADGNATAMCANDPNAPWMIQAVAIWGTGGCMVERVRAINTCGMGANGKAPAVENFVVCVNAPVGASVGNRINGCFVTDFHNPTGLGCCSAISLNCWDAGTISGEITDCYVELNGEKGSVPGGEFAFNLTHGKDVRVSRNRSRGAQRGFNNDTKDNEGLIVTGNYFELPPGICCGVLLTNGNKGSIFEGNTIVVKGAHSCGFQIERAGDSNDIEVINNRIISVGAWQGIAYAINCNSNLDPAKVPVNVTLRDNQVWTTPAAQQQVLVPESVVKMTGNTVNGRTDLWPVKQLSHEHNSNLK